MKRNNKGFTLVESLLIIIALALVGGVGFYVYNSNVADNKNEQFKTQANIESRSDTAPNKPATDPYEGWKTYNDKGVSFKYPADYYVDTSASNVVEVSSFVPGNGEPAKLDCPAQGFSIPKCEVKVSILLEGTMDESSERFAGKIASYGPEDSDLREVAEKIISSIKRQ